MRTRTVDLDALGEARGAVVVVDVLRACTTAAAAIDAGASEVVPAGSVEEALALGRELGGVPVVGEVGGFPVEGFDATNSPVAMAGAVVAGRPIVLRTTAGTQGLLRSRTAAVVLAAGFVTARATVAALRAGGQREVTFVVTGSHSDDRGEEDRALADYLTARLHGEAADPEVYLGRARASASARRFAAGGELAAYAADVDACLALDRFDFALRLVTHGGLPRLRAVSE